MIGTLSFSSATFSNFGGGLLTYFHQGYSLSSFPHCHLSMITALLPSALISFCTAVFMLLIVASTLMMQKMPKVMPSRERNVRSLLERNSVKAIFRLVQMIFR